MSFATYNTIGEKFDVLCVYKGILIRLCDFVLLRYFNISWLSVKE